MLRLFVATCFIATMLLLASIDATDIEDQDIDKSACFENIKSGSCMALFPSWAYQPEKGTCVSFVYGGCEGNSNRFKTFEDCMKTCNPANLAHI